MKKIKLTCAHAIVKFLTSQKILIDGKKEPLFAGAFGIFGHGNVACLGQALEENKDKLPTYRGHHEQNMALTGIAYARAKRRKQVFVATSSVGPGSTNMVTAAAVAMSNRLPILFLPGDTYANRMPDPVLQQVEHFNNPGITQNDAFKPVTKYFDRITRPEQILQTFPQAVQVLLDPADCGPACISLSQDIQGETYDYPEEFFVERVHNIRRPKPDDFQVKQAVEKIKNVKARGNKVIALGTTSLRVLETASIGGTLKPFTGDTDLFITPGFKFNATDALITNFHLPKSTLIMLASALAGRERLLNAYEHAKRENYRFFSYGDACLIDHFQR